MKEGKASFPWRKSLGLSTLTVLILLLILVFIDFRYWNTSADLESLFRKMVRTEEILSRMRINLLKSAEIEKAAVMADTDDLSRSLAVQSSQLADSVERDRRELDGIVEQDTKGQQRKYLNEFDGCWTELRKIDKVLLGFAVENTNLKAASLAFSQGSRAMERLERSLTAIIDNAPQTSQGNQILRLANSALTAGFKVLYLQSPHIMAASDAAMDKMELEIRRFDELVKQSLEKLVDLIPEEDRVFVDDAVSAHADFERITTEVIRLSRENTNIKSFELSLGRKRKIAVQCDEILGAFQAAIHARTFEATR